MPNAPEGTGAVLGLRTQTASSNYLARASVEGVTFGLRYCFDRLQELGVSAEQVCLIGGGSKSPTWRQIVANIFGVEVVTPKIKEGPAFGAALQAAWCIQGGRIQDLTDQFTQSDDETRCCPNLKDWEKHQETYELYCKLSDELRHSTVFPTHRKIISGENLNSK